MQKLPYFPNNRPILKLFEIGDYHYITVFLYSLICLVGSSTFYALHTFPSCACYVVYFHTLHATALSSFVQLIIE